MNKTTYLIVDSIVELSNELNKLVAQGYEVFSTQVFPSNEGYDCLVWYKSQIVSSHERNEKGGDALVKSPSDSLKQERINLPITKKQIWKLKQLGYSGSFDLSINEAKEEIQRRLK